MLLSDVDYHLPPEAVAQRPAEPRDAARLLVDAGPGRPPAHRTVADLPGLVGPGDVLVVNTTRVLPARLHLRKPTGGAAEVLLLERAGEGAWEALVRPGRRLPPGTLLTPGDPFPAGGSGTAGGVGTAGGPGGPVGAGDSGTAAGDSGTAAGDTGGPGVGEAAGELVVEVGARLGEDGRRLVHLRVGPGWAGADAHERELAALQRHGTVPLPPYVTEPLADTERYQTVYAERPGSVAAPTAGLHLTGEVLARCREAGARVEPVELVVGLGTFRPIATERVEDHRMHGERYRVPPSTLAACDGARRVVAVGTTAVRALESAALTGRPEGRTELFIRRPWRWRVVDALLTNFHMPRSSLLVLVDAFVGERGRTLYAAARDEGYRFLSFGDAMLLQRSAPAGPEGAAPAAGPAPDGPPPAGGHRGGEAGRGGR